MPAGVSMNFIYKLPFRFSFSISENVVSCKKKLSLLAAEDLVKLGYTNIKEFGGIIHWPYETQ